MTTGSGHSFLIAPGLYGGAYCHMPQIAMGHNMQSKGSWVYFIVYLTAESAPSVYVTNSGQSFSGERLHLWSSECVTAQLKDMDLTEKDTLTVSKSL